jgi:hypothetical protein
MNLERHQSDCPGHPGVPDCGHAAGCVLSVCHARPAVLVARERGGHQGTDLSKGGMATRRALKDALQLLHLMEASHVWSQIRT